MSQLYRNDFHRHPLLSANEQSSRTSGTVWHVCREGWQPERGQGKGGEVGAGSSSAENLELYRGYLTIEQANCVIGPLAPIQKPTVPRSSHSHELQNPTAVQVDRRRATLGRDERVRNWVIREQPSPSNNEHENWSNAFEMSRSRRTLENVSIP